MRIGDGYSKLIPTSVDSAKKGAAAGRGTSEASGSAGAPAATGEKVTVSAEARRLADQATAAAQGNGKVESLRASIEAGTFKADKQLIASRIVDGGG